MAEYTARLGCTLVPVGAAFDFNSGTKRSAPRWVQRMGIEWLFRLAQEPRRLWRRYLIGIPVFMFGVVTDLWRPRPKHVQLAMQPAVQPPVSPQIPCQRRPGRPVRCHSPATDPPSSRRSRRLRRREPVIGVVLAAGAGRVLPYTQDIPKTLLPVQR